MKQTRVAAINSESFGCVLALVVSLVGTIGKQGGYLKEARVARFRQIKAHDTLQLLAALALFALFEAFRGFLCVAQRGRHGVE